MPLDLSLIGSWSGTTFTAYASVWQGKFKSQSTSLTASWDLFDAGYSKVTSSDITIWVDFSVSVGDQEWLDGKNFNVDFSDTYSEIYNKGWNDCRDAMKTVDAYSRSAGSYGGTTEHFRKITEGVYVSCGSGWYQTSSITAYSKPDKAT